MAKCSKPTKRELTAASKALRDNRFSPTSKTIASRVLREAKKK